MQTKIFNSYRITHKNGSIEDINALDLVQAIENMSIPETESPVLQVVLLKEGVKTLIEDEPTEITFSAIVAENGGGSIATPAQGQVHVGDELQFRAIPARNYSFVSWTFNGEVISTEEVLNLKMPELPKGTTDAVLIATFKLSNITWSTQVEPSEASTAGCLAFPSTGETVANATAQILACSADGFVFDHWERNGENISTNKILETNVQPPALDETEVVYKAVFKTKE
mgnify:CR=1 FL=1